MSRVHSSGWSFEDGNTFRAACFAKNPRRPNCTALPDDNTVPRWWHCQMRPRGIRGENLPYNRKTDNLNDIEESPSRNLYSFWAVRIDTDIRNWENLVFVFVLWRKRIIWTLRNWEWKIFVSWSVLDTTLKVYILLWKYLIEKIQLRSLLTRRKNNLSTNKIHELILL